ncbi:valine--tRNA ligase [Desulfonema ishimotonii]|uniref:Valine--tRNA ligase n=1 Tax=Desulfonema ishimotonii TaxID=45657 RepID=A0A401G2F4_9BACT|nr:valine--tRNA ligase [Desulfonema ishimotonii]GBC63410.1 valine--tRNA ligase [Desulfonema ishimotonii]
MSTDLLDKGYEPHDVEKRWYDFWQQEGLFSAEETGDRKGYAIVIPPPNVTGVLHMGHALNNTLQDILCRYRRLRGDNVLWMPGTDHAGIATQNVVERQLASEGTDRHALGREKFVERVWEWRKEYGGAIINQLKRMGASCDWDRERFTMDEGLSRAVRKVFVRLYEDGLIYRGNYIINWCPRCHTALADLEVEHEELDAHLYFFKYPFPDSDEGITIATTRPETMLGDTAVAVNPEDERYLNIPAEEVILPLANRRIPVIRDTYVDMSFGTGGLKVTPAHDPNDFEIGRRHNLPAVKAIGDDGRMTAEAGKYEGMDRMECRKAVLKDLEAAGLLVKIEPLKHSVGHCYRCHTVIEPNLSKQWFVKAKPLAAKALAAVREGQTKIIPATWENTYYDWLENIRDWCISRQIWWGHQIPAWTCEDCGEVIVTMEDPTECPKCKCDRLVRETDVLDTWFSSALWPFSTMGWPDEAPLLRTFYPTSTLITGFDILFFWVARMMMMGIHFMGEVPFKNVYVHALVRDENGQKMSKSKGNVIDPLTVIEEYGTDAFRFTLTAFAAQGRDVRMSVKRVEGYRNFINKLWNAARFSLMHLETAYPDMAEADISLPDRWILSRLDRVTRNVRETLDEYRFNDAASAIYQFVWHEFCDWYLEAAKPALYGKRGDAAQNATRSVLWRVLRETLILLHPFIPFVTEEIWHKLPGTEGSIMKAQYPSDNPDNQGIFHMPEAESRMNTAIATITGVRNIRGEMNIRPSMTLDIRVQSPDAETRQVIEAQREMIIDLARLSSLTVEEPGERPKSAATAIIENATIFASLEGIIDFAQEEKRLAKEIAKVEKEMAGVSKKLHNEDFLAKAPPEVVEKVRDRHSGFLEKHQKLQSNLEKIRSFVN